MDWVSLSVFVMWPTVPVSFVVYSPTICWQFEVYICIGIIRWSHDQWVITPLLSVTFPPNHICFRWIRMFYAASVLLGRMFLPGVEAPCNSSDMWLWIWQFWPIHQLITWSWPVWVVTFAQPSMHINPLNGCLNPSFWSNLQFFLDASVAIEKKIRRQDLYNTWAKTWKVHAETFTWEVIGWKTLPKPWNAIWWTT